MSTAAQALLVTRVIGRVAAWAEASKAAAVKRWASMVGEDVCGFLGFSGTAATRQGVEGWTLGLRREGPDTMGFYVGGRGSMKGVIEELRGEFRWEGVC